MIKRLTYYTVLSLVFGCQTKTENHSQHSMAGMEGISMEEMKHDTSSIENFLYDVVNPVNEVVISKQATIKATAKEFGKTILSEGYITFDERRNNKVSARFGGRVEKLFVKYNYQYVKKGEKIMGLYSPEVNTIEEEYIHHLTTASDNNLIQKTKEKLLLLGLSEKEISEIEKNKKPIETIFIYSSYEGYVLFESDEMKKENTYAIKQSGMNMEMVSVQNNIQNQSPVSLLREGSYVNTGQTLFTVNDFKEVWAIAAFSLKDEFLVKLNATAIVTSDLIDEAIGAKINFIEPIYKEGQKFTQARIYLKNENLDFKINSLITIQISDGNENKSLSIPTSTILDLGERKIVWIKIGNNKFQARNVFIGKEANGFTEVVSGLTEKDEVVKDAGFIIDSESLINVKIK